MKITKFVVKNFESDQKQYGTRLAIYNLLWLNAARLLQDIGVRGIKTSHKERKK